MSAAFTPGPWKFTGGAVQTADGAYVCDLSSPRGAAERDATGHLIAAAPKLYDLAEQFERVAEYELRKMEREKAEDDEGIRLRLLNLNLIRDTLAKARGDQ